MSTRGLLQALAAATLFVILIVVVLLRFPPPAPPGWIASALLMPGVWAVYSWAPLHSGSAFVLAHIIDIAFYALLFAMLRRLLRRSGARARPLP